MLRLLVLFFFAVLQLSAFGSADVVKNDQASRDDAQALYNQGKFNDALELLLKSEPKQAHQFYNIGNCYFKLGKPGQALAYYEKARALQPSDKDILYNLEMATQELKRTGSLLEDKSWRGTLLTGIQHLPLAFYLFCLTLVALGFAFYLRALRKRNIGFQGLFLLPGFYFFSVFLFFSLTVCLVDFAALNTKQGVVIADTVAARSGPAESFTELLKIPAGTKVECTGKTKQEWIQISFSDGLEGWIQTKDILTL